MLGYDTKESFRKVIMRAITACARLGIDPHEDFSLHTDGQYKLTRYACYLVTMSADNKKAKVAVAQVYLATIADTFRQPSEQAEILDRLETREKTKDSHRALQSTAKAHGISGAGYSIFMDAGYRGMYNCTLSKIKELKGIPDNANFFDWLGHRELAANLFRLTETEARIKSKNIYGQALLNQAASDVGKQVRRTMEANDGIAPEALPKAEPLNKAKKAIKDAKKRLSQISPPPKQIENDE